MLEWVFWRLSFEESFKIYGPGNHPLLKNKSILFDFIQKDFSVLDIGCGNGEVARLLAARSNNVVAIDYNESRICEAISKYAKNNIEFIHGNALDYLNKTNKKFNMVVLSHVIEHIEDPFSLLKQLSGFTQYIYLEVPDLESDYLKYFRKDLDLPLIYMDDDHVFEFTREDLLSLVKEAGMQVLKSEYRFGMQRIICRFGA